MAGARRTTLEQHTVEGELTEERSRLHAQIIRELVEGAPRRDVREAVLANADPQAASLTHDEASGIAKAATDVAIQLGKSLVIDAVGRDERRQFSSKIYRLRELGYRVTVRYATVSVAVAQRREAQRAATTGRSVPPDVLLEAHREVSKAFPRIARIDGVRVEVYDTSEDEPVLIAEVSAKADSGGVEVHRADSYHRFLDKANG